jgi:phosphoglycolate phosphatase
MRSFYSGLGRCTFMTTPLRNFDLIVFDWDGTLFDSTALIARCIQAACADLGAAVPTDVQASYVIGLGLTEALQHAAPALPRERYHELTQRYRHHYFARQHELVFFEGVQPMLQALKERNHLLGVATGKTRRGLNDVLSCSGLSSYFDATRTADETASKPHPQMLLELMSELGVAAHRTLMIGDTTHDLQLAANAATASLGVSYGAHPHESFSGFATRYVAHSVAQLSRWLEQHG